MTEFEPHRPYAARGHKAGRLKGRTIKKCENQNGDKKVRIHRQSTMIRQAVLTFLLCSTVASGRRRGLFQAPFSHVLEPESNRSPKYMSLFNIVKFPNDVCTSSADNTVSGTCYSSSECESNGGAASGNCAQGKGQPSFLC